MEGVPTTSSGGTKVQRGGQRSPRGTLARSWGRTGPRRPRPASAPRCSATSPGAGGQGLKAPLWPLRWPSPVAAVDGHRVDPKVPPPHPDPRAGGLAVVGEQHHLVVRPGHDLCLGLLDGPGEAPGKEHGQGMGGGGRTQPFPGSTTFEKQTASATGRGMGCLSDGAHGHTDDLEIRRHPRKHPQLCCLPIVECRRLALPVSQGPRRKGDVIVGGRPPAHKAGAV